MTAKTTKPVLTRVHRVLIALVVVGAVIIAGIGFAGSYAAVRELAEEKKFGAFAPFFPIGIDAGIVVLLSLDLLLTWLRIPFPLLRQTAWLLTAATIAFNSAASWPDPLGVGMHAVIPLLFVVTVEAARHAVGRIADITADKHMEGVRISRWLLSPGPTFLLWRRMRLWEIRSFADAVKLEQHRLVYEAQLQAQYGRRWRRKAPIEELMPLRLARIGVPLAETAPQVLQDAGLAVGVSVPAQRAEKPAELVSTEDQRPQREERETSSAPQATTESSPVGEGVEEARDNEAAVVADDRPPATTVADDRPSGPDVADDRPVAAEVADDRSAAADVADDRPAAPRSPREPAMPQAAAAPPLPAAPAARVSPEPPVREPVAASPATASLNAGGGVPRRTSAETPAGRAETSAAGAARAWESAEIGTATALQPEPETEPVLDSVQQQIVTVAEWLAEAEDAGKKLSGAEVARRLGTSPRTGQRRLDKAAEHLADQRQQQARTRLRSVMN